MQRKSIPQTMAAKMKENHRQNTDYYTRKEHWTWSTNMAAMTSKFNLECVIQYYTDQGIKLSGVPIIDMY